MNKIYSTLIIRNFYQIFFSLELQVNKLQLSATYNKIKKKKKSNCNEEQKGNKVQE